MPHESELDVLLPQLATIARKAGDVLMKHYGALSAGDVDFKGRRDLLTIADREAEETILAEVRRLYPDHAILAEESGEANTETSSAWKWIIDPLDGTTNFVHGIPVFGVSIGVVYDGEPVAGCVFAPKLDELFLAGLGRGATLNGESISVTDTTEVADSLLATGFAYRIENLSEDNLDHFQHLVRKSRAVRRLGSAAMDLAFTACGRFDGFWELHLSPWDVCAGALLVREAGGEVSEISGGAGWLYGKSILAANPAMRATLERELNRSKQ